MLSEKRRQAHKAAANHKAKLKLPFSLNVETLGKYGIKLELNVISLGSIDTRKKYFTSKLIFPVGYKVQTILNSTVALDTTALYTMEIIDGGETGPSFQVTSEAGILLCYVYLL